jgi:hypothetical protein
MLLAAPTDNIHRTDRGLAHRLVVVLRLKEGAYTTEQNHCRN